MSLESVIAGLVSACNTLTAAVTSKIQVIDQKVAAATEQVPAAVRAEVVKVIYVDSAAGSNTNIGSAAAPLRSIGAAIDKVMTGGTAEIRLNRGQVYEVGEHLGGSNVDRKAIMFIPYGTASAMPIIRGVCAPSASGYVCNAFIGQTEVNIKFTECRIETGIAAGATYDAGDFGGLFSRGGGPGESVSFSVFIHRSELYVQDVPTFTTYFGFLNLSIALSSITKGGKQTKIIDSQIPKVVDISTNSISGYGASTTIESLMSLEAGSYIARKSYTAIA